MRCGEFATLRFAMRHRGLWVKYFYLVPLMTTLSLSFIFTGYPWPSDRQTVTIHRQLTDRAYTLVESRLFSVFLLSRKSLISEYTTSLENDTHAHGDNLYRNHGDITALFSQFLSTYSVAGREEEAAKYMGYCIHLLEDMNVPAHAYNIPHYSPPQRFIDNLEIAAWTRDDISAWLISSLSVEAVRSSDPASYYYQEAIRNTRAAVQSSTIANYWHEGTGNPWCGGYGIPGCQDGPAGYYTNPYVDLDLFPILPISGSQAESFLKDRLNNSVLTVARFLLSTDQLLSQHNTTLYLPDMRKNANP
jgi:hypothetical protein